MSDPTSTFSTADLTPENAAALGTILASSHPLMVEAFYLAAIPGWYDRDLLETMRNKDDGREEGLIARLSRYSFVSTLGRRDEAGPAYAVRPEERDFLQRRWIAEDPQAYRAAHRRALAFWEAHPDPNAFAQAQNCLYHRFFVDYDASIRDLISLFRTYANDYQFAAIDRILIAAQEASAYVALLDSELTAGIDDLLTYLEVRLAQLRGQWARSLELLEAMGPTPVPSLSPYIARAYGYAFAQDGHYVEAIQRFKEALASFDKQEDIFVDFQSRQNDRAYTLIALGDAYVNLATSVRGDVEREPARLSFRQRVRDLSTLVASLPLVLYLSPSLGWRVWQPRFWHVLRDLDWVIARLFVTGASYYRQADRLLEAHGTPAEAVVADEKLACLYMALGDVEQAEHRFLRLLAGVEAPLSRYHQASVSVGLGETYLQLRRPMYALKPLRSALPVLATYGDRELEARAHGLLGRALLVTGRPTEAIHHLTSAQNWYQAEGRWVEATRLVEHLETWEQSTDVADSVQARIAALISGLRKRQYVGIFQHRLPIYFRRLVVMLLPIILIIAQLLTVTVETGSGLAPEIRFRPAPLLDPDQEVTPNLSLGVTTAEVTVLDDASVVLQWAILLILGYLLISMLLGVAIILFTQLRTVQARGRGATVCFDDQSITVGRGSKAPSLRWADISCFVKANVHGWARPIRSSSAFGLGNTQEPLVIGGDTGRYTHLRERVAQLVTPATRIVNLDYAILRSKMGALFALSLLLLGLFDYLAYSAPRVFREGILGTIYSWADLYPYLFLGLVIAPLWWGIVQPLRKRTHLWPRGHFALWVLGLGLLLTLVQVITRFRPLLTVANLYPPFVTIVVMASAGIAIWRAHASGRSVYPVYARVSVAVIALLVCGLMLSVLQRDLRAYHHLVAGHALRDQALQDDVSIREEFLMEKAVAAYARAAEIGSQKLWRIDTRAAASVPLGIPAPDSFVWLSALTNQAALQVQLGDYEEAFQDFTDVLAHTDRPDRVYAWRALALQGLATTTGDQGDSIVDRLPYERAIDDLNEAIRLNPDDHAHYLWRGVAQHALGWFQEADSSYEFALARDSGDEDAVCLTRDQRERALTGQGWIEYMREDYKQALELFWQAKEADRLSAEAWVGEGYTLYALGLFEDVLPVWEAANKLDPQDATILISLGTLHWKFGNKSEELGRDRCDEYRQSVDLFTQAVDREKLHPQRDEEVAYTYRTRGQLLYLLGNCPEYSRTEMLEQAVASYSEAIRLDPDNADYWQMRGRLSYVVWLLLSEQSGSTDPTAVDWLLRGVDDIERALELDPVDRVEQDRDYRPNAWKVNLMLPLFKLGLTALQEGDVARAVDFYSRGVDAKADTVDAAVKLALIAMTHDDIPEAARWFNEAIRRIADDRVQDYSTYEQQYNSRFKASRDHLKALWAMRGVTANALLVEMESQLPGLLQTYPELQDQGYYWRYRAWFKYHVGLSAFRLGAEADAYALLQSGQADAARAYDLSTEHAYVHTYLPESAWGWYHIERGNDYAAQQSFSAALADYEAAFESIVPKDNRTAEAEKTDAAFSAGLTALRLGEFERAAAWYDAGLILAREYRGNSEVQDELTRAVQELQALKEENPDIASVAGSILEKLD